MPLQTPREIPANEAELDDLAHRAGAIPGFNARPWDSIRMLERIEGRKGYLTALNDAAVVLYDLLQQDLQIQEHIEADKEVVLGSKAKGKIPAWPREAAPQALLALQHILHNCAFIASSPLVRTKTGFERRSYIAVPMNRNEFVRGHAYGHLNYEAFRGMIYSLAIASPPGSKKPWLEYIHPKISKKDGRRTRIGPEEDFRTWMLQAGLIFPYHPHGQRSRWPKTKTSLLWLRLKPSPEDDHEDDVKEPLLRPLQGEEMILPAINERLSALKIACLLPNYGFYEKFYDFREGRSKLRLSGSKQLYRAFSGEDGHGGRLYGSWVQGVPSGLRRYLTINGRPTVELDYGSMQLVLLYAMHGLPVPDGDLYEIPGQLRDVMKLVLTVSVGAKTKSAALGGIRDKLQDDNTISHRAGDAERYYSTFWQHHSAVYPHGGQSNRVWAELQYADSQIGLRVLRYLLEQGIPAIPIHDSFIVQEQYELQLEQAMKQAFQDFWPETPIQIKKAMKLG